MQVVAVLLTHPSQSSGGLALFLGPAQLSIAIALLVHTVSDGKQGPENEATGGLKKVSSSSFTLKGGASRLIFLNLVLGFHRPKLTCMSHSELFTNCCCLVKMH